MEARYRVVMEKTVTGKVQYSVEGPGVHRTASKPWFENEGDAETLCRILGCAFAAGMSHRSLQLSALLGDTTPR